MKHVKVIVVIVLIGILYGQLYYYNRQKIKAEAANKVSNTTVKNELTKEEKIALKNDSSEIFARYAFGISQEDFDKNIKEFAEKSLKTIHDETSGKSEDYIKQYYDLHEKEVNNMLIYSSEDFIGIAAAAHLPYFSKNPEYQGMDIDFNSAVEDELYYTFDGLLNYSTNGDAEIRISIAKDAKTTPIMKIKPLIETVDLEDEEDIDEDEDEDEEDDEDYEDEE